MKARPDRLFVLDLGSSAQAVIPGTPTCFIDHHRPEGVPPGATLISGYTWDPIPNTSWMMFELGSALAETEGLDWIAVIGTLSDLGEKAPWPKIAEVKKRYGAKWLKEATVLVNAPRRSAAFQVEAAARALLENATPRELCESDSADVQELRRARAEVAAEMEIAKKAAPVFAGKTALVRVNSPCQIHPLIAQIWRGRLPKYYVLVANEGYMPDRVNFAARGEGILDFIKSIQLSEGEGTYGHGHEAASGGSLSVERWNELLEKVGFGPEVRAGKR
jgi:single-stranded-DNA-specific exonuclease